MYNFVVLNLANSGGLYGPQLSILNTNIFSKTRQFWLRNSDLVWYLGRCASESFLCLGWGWVQKHPRGQLVKKINNNNNISRSTIKELINVSSSQMS